MKTRIYIELEQLMGDKFERVASIQETHEVSELANLESKFLKMLQAFTDRIKKMNE